jgi:hypothetical protein
MALFIIVAAPPAFAQAPPPTIDHTSYTYSVPAGGIGSFASMPVTRTFDQPIASLRLFIVAGQADDIGYVGARMVTSMPAMCAGVGAVTGEQEVTDQVTISGNTASFVLRAQENCCCTTGWGSATAAGRADALFRWEVTLGGESCDVEAVAPITDPLAQSFEAGNTIDTSRMNAAMQAALTCLRNAAAAAGGSITVTSAFRPVPYQQHLREVWDKWELLRNNRDPECADRRSEVEQEFRRHALRYRPAVNSGHTRGEAMDINWNLPAGTTIDALAESCNLHRPVANDPVHFILR